MLMIPGYPNYAASEDGKIWTIKSKSNRYKNCELPCKLTLTRGSGGYLTVSLFRDEDGVNKKRCFKVHRLICKTFLGDSDLPVLHYNGIKTDNRLSNLRYGTPLENGMDNRRLGEAARGVDNSNSKLTEAEVIQIRRMRAEGLTLYQIYDKTGVPANTIHEITTTWKDAPETTRWMYVCVRVDIPLADQLVQVGHVCIEAGKSYAYASTSHLVVLQVANKSQLLKVTKKLDHAGKSFVMFTEPDDDMGETALATEPLTDKELFRGFFLWKHDECTDKAYADKTFAGKEYCSEGLL